MQGYDGIVVEVGLRSTRLRTLNGRMVTLANSEVADSAIENISSEPSRKITMDLGLTYDTDEVRIQRAMEILQELLHLPLLMILHSISVLSIILKKVKVFLAIRQK
ncbi:MAG: hypothetical protein B5M52_03800 [Helicobacteraceae bacterium 4484_230]|nr:MAG: hypothetical protein B5M52_03800 [Helicobacteraceae bacterium 4484_230]